MRRSRKTGAVAVHVLVIAALAAGGALNFLWAPGAWAHAAMTKSAPSNGAMLASPPALIQAWFSDEVTASGSYLRLYDAHDTLIARGGLDPKVSSHTVLRLVPPRLRPGAYLVRWHVVAAEDNHVTEGYFRFSIGAAAVMAPSTAAAPAAASSAMAAPALPALDLVAPQDHSTVKNPVAVVIQTPGDIKALTMGGMNMSGMGSTKGPAVHLHILVDGVTTMPSSDQLTPAGTHRYQYLLAPLSRGAHTVKVFWADNKTHEAVGPVHAATFTVAP
jgi:copper resistance protein C